MSRFHVTTLASLVVMAIISLAVDGVARWWMVGAVVVAYAVLFGCGVAFIRWRFFTPAVCRVKTEEKVAALTFDDGPDVRTTGALLDELKKHGVSAAFFAVGRNIMKAPSVARRIVDEGHLLENHTYRHAWWTNFLFGRGLQAEIEAAQRVIAEAAGGEARFFRSPMGLTNPHFPRVLRRSGLVLVGWDVRSLDKGSRSAEGVVARITRRVRNGSIILMHDGGVDRARLLAIVSGVVQAMNERGYELVRLDHLLDRATTDEL